MLGFRFVFVLLEQLNIHHICFQKSDIPFAFRPPALGGNSTVGHTLTVLVYGLPGLGDTLFNNLDLGHHNGPADAVGTGVGTASAGSRRTSPRTDATAGRASWLGVGSRTSSDCV